MLARFTALGSLPLKNSRRLIAFIGDRFALFGWQIPDGRAGSITCGFAGAWLLIGAFLGHQLLFSSQYQTAGNKLTAAQKWAGQLLLSDERLTMAANMAAASGDERWMDRYEENIPLIDQAIREATALAPASAARLFDQETRVANDRLVELERASFAAIRQGELRRARGLLGSPLYQAYKQSLNAGSQKFLNTMLEEARRDFSDVQWRSVLAGFLLAALACCGLLIMHRHFETRFRKLEETTAEQMRSLNEAKDALAGKNSALVIGKESLEVALHHMGRGLSMFDADERLIVCNQLYRKIYDLPDELTQPGTSIHDILKFDAERAVGRGNPESVELAGNWLAELRDQLTRGETFTELQHLSGGQIVNVTFQPLAYGGWIDVQEDITERHRAERKIAHMAGHDALTDLPNRVLLANRLGHLLSQTAPGVSLAVHFLDLDGFKAVNDTMGHAIGDDLLKAVAQRLQHCVRDEDVVARISGDEFAIVQVNVASPNQVRLVADRILEAISAPYEIATQRIVVGTSIGIALSPNDGADGETLLRNADLAMYRAKHDGRGIYRFFDRQMSAEVQARHSLKQDLRDALTNQEFELFYQPQVSVEGNALAGFEALLRWHHPVRGLVPPSEFIPLAEESGLIVPIGAWVLREACAQAQSWPSDVKVAVNVSVVQLRQRSFIETVVLALGSSGLSPHRLEIEITESLLADTSPATIDKLTQLHDLGVRIALDDFGTGYSSLSYLRTLPIDKIKIDRSFVKDLQDGGENALVLVRSVANIGSTLGMIVCAEGVETPEQLTTIRDEGCTEMQGYLFSRPVPVSEIKQLLQVDRRALGAASSKQTRASAVG